MWQSHSPRILDKARNSPESRFCTIEISCHSADDSCSVARLGDVSLPSLRSQSGRLVLDTKAHCYMLQIDKIAGEKIQQHSLGWKDKIVSKERPKEAFVICVIHSAKNVAIKAVHLAFALKSDLNIQTFHCFRVFNLSAIEKLVEWKIDHWNSQNRKYMNMKR